MCILNEDVAMIYTLDVDDMYNIFLSQVECKMINLTKGYDYDEDTCVKIVNLIKREDNADK